ncbi:hypothetical protein CARUB_v10027483mg [Capsella rubella]|uniref:Uncharacterized protein n=1 Tax=Capsella rubella TaxID=81985 RepID=R0GCC5_9BRAS|nr:uncharacterized protein LOC17874641 [Capsella rubella]EOA14314.1 hypothetical protein CARUB_v10027483mg [Capsella rubella]
MEKKSTAQLGLVLFLLVVLLVTTQTECALPSPQESLSMIGSRRRLMSSYKTNSDIDFGGSISGQAGGGINNP